jgi:GAF domain-containing protein
MVDAGSTAQDMSADGVDPVGQLGAVMSRVSRQLQEEHGNIEATLQAITATAVRVVPHAEDCSISYVIGRSKVEPRASTSDLPRQVDALQGRIGQGPCLDAVWDAQIVRVDDVAADERWPEFARQAAELGIGSMLCFQLFVTGDRLGACNLFSRTPRAFDDESEEIGLMLAAHAGVALAGAEHESNLRAGMSSRDVIGQAKGILMERHRLTADQAFGVLSRVSQELNRKLVDIAGELTDTRAVPGSQRRQE